MFTCTSTSTFTLTWQSVPHKVPLLTLYLILLWYKILLPYLTLCFWCDITVYETWILILYWTDWLCENNLLCFSVMKYSDNTQKQKEPHMMKSLLDSVEDFTRRWGGGQMLVNNRAKNDARPLYSSIFWALSWWKIRLHFNFYGVCMISITTQGHTPWPWNM